MDLTSFRTLGRSGLAVSPIALGTMTFGTPDWGSSDDVSQTVFNTYVDAGGNFIDTADLYAGGRSEELIGNYVAARQLRDQLVVATKFGFSTQPGNPHGGGNGRKHIYQALEASLRRLRTDYVDMYWLHAWDGITPADEVLHTLGDLVRAGKIRYFGLSDLPVWFATQMTVLAQAHGMPGPVALQMEYSLVARTIEREYVPATHALGLGIMPWSPLAGGFLTGKYERGLGVEPANQLQGRLSGKNPFSGPLTKFTERNWHILEVVKAIATEQNRPAAQVALAWVIAQPGVNTTLAGASRPEQLQHNLAALDVILSPEQQQRLQEASAIEIEFPYNLLTPQGQQSILGANATAWQ